MSRHSLSLLASLAVLVVSCGLASDDLGQETGDLTSVGPHATAASVRIVYPEELPALGTEVSAMMATWNDGIDAIENAPGLVTVGDAEAGNPDIVAVDPRSGIAVDVIAPEGVVVAAQLTIVDGAGDDEDEGNLAALRLFLEAVGLEPDAVIAAVGSDPVQLHVDDQDIEGVYRTSGATVFYAANEDTVLVGVLGPWDD